MKVSSDQCKWCWLTGCNIWSGWNSTPDGHLHKVTYTRCRINTIDSPDDEHRGARKHVENWNKYIINIYEKELQHLYRS
jgi:hypothetical protein